MPVYSLEIIVAALGIVMLLLDAFANLSDKRPIAWLGVIGLIVTFVLLFKVQWPDADSAKGVFWSFYAAGDQLSLFYKGIAILTTIVVLIMAVDFSPIVIEQTAAAEKGAHRQAGLGEFFALPVFACAGLMWMASANNLASIFVSLEMVTITFYIMVAYLRRNVGSLEAGVKYLILGALSTGFLVYGFAWLFGITGSMELPAIKEALASGEVNSTAALFAFGLILMAMAFKVGGAPFHSWIPDVYQGAPTPITAFLSVGSKAAGFIVFLRLSTVFLESKPLSEKVTLVLTVIAILTLLIGNLSALPQTNFKRLLAYSSVAHAGFLLMALACAPVVLEGQGTVQGMLPTTVISFYLAAYLLMTLLAFLVLSTLRNSFAGEELESYRGLARRSPFLAIAMLIAMASLAGIPLTAGFFGKLFAFNLALQQEKWILLAVAAIGAMAGFYYYLKIAASMFLSGGGDDENPGSSGALVSTESIAVSVPTRIAMVTLMIGIVWVGVNPGVILELLK